MYYVWRQGSPAPGLQHSSCLTRRGSSCSPLLWRLALLCPGSSAFLPHSYSWWRLVWDFYPTIALYLTCHWLLQSTSSCLFSVRPQNCSTYFFLCVNRCWRHDDIVEKSGATVDTNICDWGKIIAVSLLSPLHLHWQQRIKWSGLNSEQWAQQSRSVREFQLNLNIGPRSADLCKDINWLKSLLASNKTRISSQLTSS